MVRMGKIALLAIALSCVAISLSLFTNGPVDAAPGPSNVKVVNTAGNPVPIAAQGITNVSGTVNLASGSTVKIANSLDTGGKAVPLIVQDVDSPGLNPIAVSGTCSSPNSCDAFAVFPSTTASGGAVHTVVIDFVSAI